MSSISIEELRKAADLGYLDICILVNGGRFILSHDVAPEYMRTMPVKYWYMCAYPSDDLGPDVTTLTFNELYNALGSDDIYNLICVSDSIVRERIFKRCCELYNVDYGSVYDKAFK